MRGLFRIVQVDATGLRGFHEQFNAPFAGVGLICSGDDGDHESIQAPHLRCERACQYTCSVVAAIEFQNMGSVF